MVKVTQLVAVRGQGLSSSLRTHRAGTEKHWLTPPFSLASVSLDVTEEGLMMPDLFRPRGRVEALFRVILFLYLFWAVCRPSSHPKELLRLQLWSRGHMGSS